jgi:hypothetical protein
MTGSMTTAPTATNENDDDDDDDERGAKDAMAMACNQYQCTSRPLPLAFLCAFGKIFKFFGLVCFRLMWNFDFGR